MQQRRVRLGDTLDDYCPRERRVTNHAVVAMIDDEVKQTRCTTCDAEHEYKEARVPAQRRRKLEGTLVPGGRPELVAPGAAGEAELLGADAGSDADSIAVDADLEADTAVESGDVPEPVAEPLVAADADADVSEEPRQADDEDEWPVHRPLIRATLPRPEGHVPERKEPEFTMRAANNNRNARNRFRGQRQAQGQGQGQGQFGNPRFGSGTQQGDRSGNRAPQAGHRGGGRPAGHGQRPGGPNRGPKRGR